MDVTVDTTYIYQQFYKTKILKVVKKATLLKMQFKKWENITKANKWR